MPKRIETVQEPIAIVGAACRFPGARDLDQFWNLLVTGRDAVSEIPDWRWSKDYYFHPNPGEPGKSYTWAAGVVDGIDEFDAAFFGISPREARQIDPQQRLVLELTAEALEDAGIPATKLAGGDAGVWMGASGSDYANARIGDPAGGDAYFMTGTTTSIVANRVSYSFDLRGPSLVVDTACSSSLVALHLACAAIRQERIPLALVGGINLLLSPFPFIGFCRASMLSPHGRCFAFDECADGYVRAEGGAVVVLKPLAAAVADRDSIRGLILGTGTNSDGRTVGLSLPNRAAQVDLLRSVYRKSGVAPGDLSYLEAHGTGTAVGDPIELAALGEALAQDRTEPLPIGSVKTNIGHLETASGMAGLLKAVLSLEKRVIPPSLNFKNPNPKISFDALNVEIVTKPRNLLNTGAQLVAGINSFGFGGTNAHAIIASAPTFPRKTEPEGPGLPPLLLSARSTAALNALADEWSNLLAGTTKETAAPLLRGVARRRTHYQHRMMVCGTTPAEIADALKSRTEPVRSTATTSGTASTTGKLAFVFSGNGSQWVGMARDAIAHSAVFRLSLATVDAALLPLLGWSIVERLSSDEQTQELALTSVAQPLLFAIQVAITMALRARGVDGAAFVGHSVGEIAAAWAAGALSLSDACKVVVARSRQQERTRGAGRMAVLGLAPEKASSVVAELGDGLEIGAFNSSSAVTIAGPLPALETLRTESERQGWAFTLLDLEYAFHSAVLEAVKDDLVAELSGIESIHCEQRFISTVSGRPAAGDALGAEHWWRNVRDPVRFREAMDYLVEQEFRTFVEIGPSPILQSYVRSALRTANVEGNVLSTLTRQPLECDPLPNIAANCYVSGYDISQSELFDGAIEFQRLPHYPWQRERYWFAATPEAIPLTTLRRHHTLLGFQSDPQDSTWSSTFDLSLHPWLADHAFEGVTIVPAAAMVEMALAACRERYGQAPALEIVDFEIPRALVLEADQARQLRVRVAHDGQLEIESRHRLRDEHWSLHAIGRIQEAFPVSVSSAARFSETRVIGAPELYRLATQLGLEYGPAFRTVSRVNLLGNDEAVVHLDPIVAEQTSGEYVVHPAMFDGALQGFIALLAARDVSAEGARFLPWRFGSVRAYAPDGRMPVSANISVKKYGSRSVCCALALFDSGGRLVADISDCWLRRLPRNETSAIVDRSYFFELAAVPRPDDTESPALDVIAALSNIEPRSRIDESSANTTLLFEAYQASAAHAALKEVVPTDTVFAISELAASGTIGSQTTSLLASLLGLIERHGGASKVGNLWRLTSEIDLPEPAAIWRTIVEDAPELIAELALAANAIDALPQGLRIGFQPGIALPATFVEQLLYDSPTGKRAIDALCQAVAALVSRWPLGRPLRILEIGAGSGALSRRILRQLAAWPGTLTYTATDHDPEAVGRLAVILRNHESVVSVQCWNSKEGAFEAPAQSASGFDLVVSGYGLTRLNFNDESLKALHEVLAQNGLLMVVEPEPCILWDNIFGQDDEWWGDSPIVGIPVSPLRDSETWCAALAKTGFSIFPSRMLASSPWSAMLLAARRTEPRVNTAAIRSAASVLVVASQDDPLGTQLCAHLFEAEMPAELVVVPEATDGAMFCASVRKAETIEIVMLPPLQARRDSETADAADRLASVLTVARLTVDERSTARIWIVTSDAQQLGTVLPGWAAPREAALWGLVRTLCNEMPQLDCRLVDFPSSWSTNDIAESISKELISPDNEMEIVWSSAGRHGMRLHRGLPSIVSDARNVALTVGQPGLLDTLHWEDTESREPRPDEIAIEVRAVGLNFRDVMWAMDLLPEEALLDGFAGPTLGLECCGVVSGIGAQMKDFKLGDRVIALAPAAFGSRVVTSANAVVHLSDALSFAAGATIPVAYLTAIYGLGRLARLRAGEVVLIHGGAGGVGLAAIQYAKHCGAIVIATAGTEIKREFLRQLGVDHVLDSRNLSFADAVKELTSGKGVDVVLNSLSGEAMERSLSVLRPFGRFIELGKRDFYLNTRVGLRPLRHNITYFAIDADSLLRHTPQLAAALLKEVAELIVEGAIRPLPHRVFTFEEVSEAFRLMQGAGHIGKIVLEPSKRVATPTKARREFVVRHDGTYVVSGGLTGFGLETARWLAMQGARHIALLGRRGGDTPGAAEVIESLQAASVDVRAFACDVADAAVLSATLEKIRKAMPAMRGIFHAAMVVDDGLLSALSADRIEAVLAPKVGGAINLDELSREDPIELFVLYSSATTIVGAPGQGSYVAANLALEAVARRRIAEGLCALVVSWGPISDTGYLARQTTMHDALLRRLHVASYTAAESLKAIPVYWSSGLPVVAHVAMQWAAADKHLPILAAPTFSRIVSASADMTSVDIREILADLSPEEAMDVMSAMLSEEIARVMSLSPDRIDRNAPLSELGMDSLMAIELRLALEGRLGIKLPFLSLSDNTTLSVIATRVLSALSRNEVVDEMVETAVRYETPDPPAVAAAAGSVVQSRQATEVMAHD